MINDVFPEQYVVTSNLRDTDCDDDDDDNDGPAYDYLLLKDLPMSDLYADSTAVVYSNLDCTYQYI